MHEMPHNKFRNIRDFIGRILEFGTSFLRDMESRQAVMSIKSPTLFGQIIKYNWLDGNGTVVRRFHPKWYLPQFIFNQSIVMLADSGTDMASYEPGWPNEITTPTNQFLVRIKPYDSLLVEHDNRIIASYFGGNSLTLENDAPELEIAVAMLLHIITTWFHSAA